MRSAVFVAISLAFLTTAFHSCQVRGPEAMYVSAENGLRIRSEPSLSGKVFTTVPYEADVLVVGTAKKSVKIDGKDGSWARVEWKGNNGWVFDAYLTSHPPEVPSRDGHANYAWGISESVFLKISDSSDCRPYGPIRGLKATRVVYCPKRPFKGLSIPIEYRFVKDKFTSLTMRFVFKDPRYVKASLAAMQKRFYSRHLEALALRDTALIRSLTKRIGPNAKCKYDVENNKEYGREEYIHCAGKRMFLSIYRYGYGDITVRISFGLIDAAIEQ